MYVNQLPAVQIILTALWLSSPKWEEDPGALKMTDMKMQEQDMKLQDRKFSVNRDYITLQCAISGCCYFS